MASSNDIRATFLDYFARNGHAVVESSPLVPRNDPTLLFTNSGMVQFKNVFTGQEKRPYTRATTAQKCVRAGGKHNDLDNVGYTARHHTFFEMLGNFSFGDYFKDQAIFHAWTLVTKDFGLPADRLLVTVFSEDDDAAALWRKIAGLPEQRIVRIPTSDNFWRMGDTGPCGPCSEIFFDHGPAVAGGPPGSAEAEGDRFVEIWNLVFMQFEEGPPGTRVPLPRPSIDTGMGLERVAAILQGKHDNYDTDTLRALILASAEATGQDPDGPHKVSHRVVADHLRSTAFLIADGVLPSNEGRGYVLRRIMRRAMRHAHMMGARDPVMWRLVPALVRQMGAAYPRTGPRRSADRGNPEAGGNPLQGHAGPRPRPAGRGDARLGDGAALPGEVAFRLYDTFGFPLDLTQDALREQGRAVDIAGFEAAMAEQRRRARAAWAGSGEAATERVWFEVKEKRRRHRVPRLLHRNAEAEILALVSAASRWSAPSRHRSGHRAEPNPVLRRKRRPGRRHRPDHRPRACASSSPTRRRSWATCSSISAGSRTASPRVGTPGGRRGRSRPAHRHPRPPLRHPSAARSVAPPPRRHVTQKGSLNAPDRLRFDVCQPTPDHRDDLAWVEAVVNARMRENTEVTTRLMTPDAAVAEGAMALFGEKYGDEVRVVAMGAGRATNPPVRSNCAAAPMSGAPAISACSASSAKAPSAPACAASRRSPARRR